MLSLAHVHPMLVHFPIVFFLSLAAFDTVAVLAGADISGRSVAGTIGFTIAVLAGLSAIAAYIFGDMALEIAEAGGFSSEIAEIHEALGGATMAAFTVWALIRGVVWWRRANLGGAVRIAVPVIEIAGAALVLVTAYYGGSLVFGLGVNVAKGVGG